MKIAFVCDELLEHGNGTSVTAYRYAEALRNLGHDVVLIGVGKGIEEKQIPLVTDISHSCGFHFGKPDEDVFDNKLKGVDLVHLFLPFDLERAALAWARKHHVAVSAAFHLQPENITYNARIGACPPASAGIYSYFKSALYNKVRHIHCPSEMIANELKRHGYKAQTHVISNGVPDIFHANLQPTPLYGIDERINILSVGRLGKEKDQATIIRAINLSKYKNRINLHLAGKGYMQNTLMDLADRLGVTMSIGYYTEEQLAELMRACPLAVHASVADIEAISVIESFASGAIPIIAKAPKSAPSSFALGRHSLFKARHEKDLAKAIDWWIEHPKVIEPTRNLYLKEAEELRLESCAEDFVTMCRQVVMDDRRAYRQEENGAFEKSHNRKFEPVLAPSMRFAPVHRG